MTNKPTKATKPELKRAVFSLTMATAFALGAAACGPSIPANPDWATDVLPILEARCNRCHNAPMGRADPAIKQTGSTPRAAIGDFTTYTSAYPLRSLIKSYVVTLKTMPPLPAAPLDSWEIQILENFAKE